MTATIKTKSYVSIYRVERDNGDGRYVPRHTFDRLRDTITYVGPQGLATHQDTDGGYVGTISVPVGSRIGETEGGDAVLILPSGRSIAAHEAMSLAHEGQFDLSVARAR